MLDNTLNLDILTGGLTDLTTTVVNLGDDVTNITNNLTELAGDVTNIDARVLDNTTSIANIDARVLNNTTLIDAANNSISILEGDLIDVDARVTVNTEAITILQQQAAMVPVGYVQDGNPAAPSDVRTNTAALVGATPAPVRLTNVAAGTVAAGSTDAVNGAQLAATNTMLDANVQTTINNTNAIAALDAAAVKYDDASRASVTLQGANGTRVSGVAAGTVAAGSTDAVNGAQLAATNAQVNQNTQNITTITNNLAGSTVVAVQYSDPANPTVSNGGRITNDVTFIGADNTMPVAVHNVAAGRSSTDAANVGQVQNGLANAISIANSYTDSRLNQVMDAVAGRFAQVDFDLADLRRDANAGVAGAMAFSGIPQVMEVGKSMLGGAVAHYRGQTAFALAFSSALGDEGKYVVKAGASMDSRGSLGMTAGGGFSF